MWLKLCMHFSYYMFYELRPSWNDIQIVFGEEYKIWNMRFLYIMFFVFLIIAKSKWNNLSFLLLHWLKTVVPLFLETKGGLTAEKVNQAMVWCIHNKHLQNAHSVFSISVCPSMRARTHTHTHSFVHMKFANDEKHLAKIFSGFS